MNINCAYFNEAVNFIYSNSHIMPHQNNADEKSEFIYLIEGILIFYIFTLMEKL